MSRSFTWGWPKAPRRRAIANTSTTGAGKDGCSRGSAKHNRIWAFFIITSQQAANQGGQKMIHMQNDTGGEEYITIGNLAKEIGLTTRTLRYYEEMGIMTPPRRLEGGIRAYPP